MKLFSRYLIVFIAAGSALLASDEKDEKFSPGPASSYPTKQTIEHVTIAAVPYITDDQTRPAFGKYNPNAYGILPILIILQNDTDKALALRNLEIHYEMPDGHNVDPTPAEDLGKLRGVKHPKQVPVAAPLPIPTGSKKNPLNEAGLEGREFAVKMVPARETANGFFYFQTHLIPGAKFYLSGIREADNGQELFYFEIPLDEK